WTLVGPVVLPWEDKDNNITLDDVELYSDRYNQGERSSDANGKWTLGALEASTGSNVNIIYWLGGDSDEWDNRNNWAYIPGGTSKQESRAIGHRVLSCVDVLSDNLTIVIPEKGSAKYPTTTKATYFYPKIPSEFASDSDARKNIVAGEQVSAGVGTGNPIEKYAQTIELEYGAALKGVHYLKESDDTYRYDEGITNMTLERDQWTLVGPVVLPWEDKDNNITRNVISNDYFLDYEPNVYMRDAEVGGTATEPSLTWNKTFPDLDTDLCEPNTAFAVSIPNSYGNYWGIGLSAQDYYGSIVGLTGEDLKAKLADVTVPKSFKPFVGRFVNDNALTTYTFDGSGNPVLLNNSYPCNIDVQALEGVDNENGIVYLYDYIAKSIKVAGDDSWTAEGSYKGYNGVNTQYIKPQNGFVFIPKKSSVQVTEDMLVGGDTKSRSLEVEKNKIAINLHAGSSNSLVHSTISIEHDPELGVGMESEINAPKVFAYREAPELYMMAHDKTLCRLAVPKSETIIPLGIQVKTPMYVTFNMVHNSGFSKVTLVDTENDYEHDLLESPYTADILPKGTCEGRYYLNIVSDASDYGDDDVTTSVEDAAGEDLAINIYNDTDNSDAITVVTSNVELEKIYVSDSMGRVIPFEAKGNYAKIQIPNAMGVYIIQVIGDKASRTEKVILK
ncbi:MAG: T9SS type A sorting domain-containing protein, partial [Paludibacteraceae bacterium]|nr:T9SS type A sorting domain-containing protein [Paludibacteraceae bacterium]